MSAPQTYEHVKRRAIGGARAMLIRTGFGQILRVLSSVCLAHLLLPTDYGVFGVVAYLTGLSMYLGDIGLAASLVRQEHDPDPDELFTVFACQQCFAFVLVAALVLAAHPLVATFGLTSSAIVLLRAMSVGLFLSSLRVIPMLMLERAVRFDVIAKCEVIESAVMVIATIGLALAKAGPWALAGGQLIRSVVGLCLVWRASPWRPIGRFRLRCVLPLLKFGIPFQLNALVPPLLGGWMPFLLGRLVGAAAVGFANWATNLSSIPVNLTAALSRVAFPAFSRLQGEVTELSKALERSITQLASMLFLAAPLAALSAPWGVPMIFGTRWENAVTLIQWLAPACVLNAITGILASAQNAVGRSADRLAVTIVTGIFIWPVAYICIRLIGLDGVGPASLLGSLAELALTCGVLRARKTIDRSFLISIGSTCAPPLLFTGLALVAAWWFPPHNRPFLRMLTGVGTFAALQLIRETSNPARPLTTQVMRGWSHLRPRTVAPSAAPSR